MIGFLRGLLSILVFVVLTLVTQVGGVALVFAQLIVSGYPRGIKRYVVGTVVFVFIYAVVSTYALPPLAANWGKERLMPTPHLKPRSYTTVLFNRNYVTHELKSEVEALAIKMNRQFHGTNTYFLDAGFPLFKWFPMLPHLSHVDGKKVDLDFYYSDETGASVKGPSWIGYGHFEEPTPEEQNQIEQCEKEGFYQYSFTKVLAPLSEKNNMYFDEMKTAYLLDMVQHHEVIKRVFIEPHLVDRFGVSHDKIAYHGCQSVRHDDHLHIEVY